MTIELKVPQVGESIQSVQIGEWLKAEGDRVERDETVVTIETDKVTVELPAPAAGTIAEIRVKNGQAASVGDVIGLMREAEKQEAPKAAAATPSQESGKPSQESGKGRRNDDGDDGPPLSARVENIRQTLPPEAFTRVMPSARRTLEERGLSPNDVEPTGPGGRVLKEDVERAAERREGLRAPGPAPAGRQEEIIPMSPLRKRVAERLVQSQQTAALLTTFNEIDMSAVMALRKEYQESFQQKYGIKLGFSSFFIKAAIEALKLIPQVNAEIRGDNIVYRNFYDIGVAVGGGKGLVVPVLRSAERLSFAELEQTIADFAKRAKDNRLKLDELQGGTFTISNGGVYGSLLSTPIVNPPQSGILGLHAIQERPVAVSGQVVVRPMMYIALTYDHRIVDGREAVTFLKRIKECVEQPSRILLEV